MKSVLLIVAILTFIIAILWLGLQVKPKSFAPYPKASQPLEIIPLPTDLPVPVERFYRTVYGDAVPVIKTVVIKGRAVLSPFGPKMPARFIFVHNAGQDYRHYIEATWFGLPLMKINESYVNGNSHFELPVGTYDNDLSITQGAVLGLWAEAAWFPSIWVTDGRVRWENVDENSALLFIPFKDGEENYIVRFDPATGLLDTMEAMRYRDAGPQAKKILWITKNIPGKNIPGTKLSATGSATWLDQGKPWAVFTLEEVNYNVDISQYILQRGP
jgi:Family of unknown function (DUF6544)